MSDQVSVNVRMYRLHELGDCFLLTFESGAKSCRMLIDCGSFRNGGDSIARLQQIAEQLRKDVGAGERLDVVVGTHQHNDHLSGFVHCEKEFRGIGVDQVWLSWLDDPKDAKAQSIGKAHDNLKLQLAAARDELSAVWKGRSATHPRAARALEVLNDMLGFYGAHAAAGGPPELPARGVRILKTLGSKKPLYLRPGRTLDLPALPAGTVRVHVLGPPRKEALLNRKDPKKGESYDHALAGAGLLASRVLEASKAKSRTASPEEDDYPFNQVYKRRRTSERSPELAKMLLAYRKRTDAWRTIDDDWLETAGALALFLDEFTNNSSLVLAIELVESGKVLLFAADAQTGNWSSWKDVVWEQPGVKTDDLLSRTVFYKVGHHASHNATLVEAFEKVNHPDLVAVIPVHKKDPNITKTNGWKMPATNLFKRLREKTENRVLQMDGVNPPSCNPTKDPARAAWKRVGITPKTSDLAIELEIRG